MTFRSQRGSAVVEFALVLPVLLLVVVGALQLIAVGRAQLQVTDAARRGAREAAVTSDDAVVGAAVAASLPELDPRGVTTSVVREGGRGMPVRVAVVYVMPIIAPVPRWLFPVEVRITGDAVARQEFG